MLLITEKEEPSEFAMTFWLAGTSQRLCCSRTREGINLTSILSALAPPLFLVL
jgi:hypothetical protein